MKNKILIGTLLFIALLTAFKYAPNNNGTAIVEQTEGVYIFVQSKPTEPTDYLGTIKRSGFLEQPSDMLPKLIKQAKKKYPDVQGLIVDINFEKADAIKFKQ